jgi:hypothetical protein
MSLMMMTNPITPPPELVKQWASEFYGTTISPGEAAIYVANQAAQWGADQELEACCEWFVRDWTDIETAGKLRAARRPRPSSLKEQAQAELDRLVALIPTEGALAVAEPIRRALEALDD